MSSPVEDEIVSMKFDNTQFQKAAGETMSTLDKLRNALKLPTSAASNGLADISKNVRGFHMNPLIDSASEVSRAFSAMSVVAISAIATIASQATQAGLGIAKSLTVSPVAQGFTEYETQLNSIQTILANTGLEGQKGLDKVNQALSELNTYSDKTIYNFTQMAKNIGTFTAAGVDLDTSTAAIKGIANLAAVSGSNSQQASTAMYQLSQALAAGRVSLMDWNSVVNAGMGGKVFQDSLMETARVHGVAIDQMVKDEGSFRNTLQKGWLTSDILTETLSKFTGDLNEEQLRAMGYTEQQIKNIIKMGQTATNAATKVKTITQLMDTLREAVGSGWARTWQLVFGDFNEARGVFTAASDALGGYIQRSAQQRNELIAGWKELKGRTVLIKAIRHAWEALLSILTPIRDAFREVFPPTTAKQLFELTQAVNHFFKALILSKDAQENLKNTFAGFFAVLHIGFTIIKGVITLLGRLVGLFLEGQGGTLALTGGLGKMLVALDKFITGGGRVEKVFNGIYEVLAAILGPLLDVRNALIGAFIGLAQGDPEVFFEGIRQAIASLLSIVDQLSAKFASAFNAISDAMGGLGHIQGFNLAGLFGGVDAGAGSGATKSIDNVKGSLEGLGNVISRIKSVWDAFVTGLTQGVSGGAGAASDQLSSKWQRVLDIFQGIGAFFKPLFDQIQNIASAIGDAFSNIGTGLDFTDVLGAIQTGLFLAIFLQIRNFAKALTNVADSASGVLRQVTSNLKSMQAEVRAAVILQIAVSLALLAGAVFLLSKTDPQSLGIALGAVVAMLTALVVAMKSLEKAVGTWKDGAKLALVSAGLLGMSIAIAALAGAVYLFSRMDMADMQKGLLGVLEAIAMLTAAAAIMSKSGAGANMIGAAAGLLIMSAAITAMAGAILLYSRIDTGTLIEGLAKVAGAIAVLAIAMNLMRTGVGGAAAMVIVAGGLIILAKALKMFGDMDTSTIVKGLLAMGGMFAVLALGMNALQAGIAGAAALVVIAYGIKLLVPSLQALGDMDTMTIVKGLAALTGVLLALALLGGLLAPVAPVLLALAGSVALLGAAVYLAGAGVLAFAAGLALLANNGNAGFGVLMGIIKDFLEQLPQMVLAFGDTIAAIAKVIGDHAPDMIDAFTKLLSALLDSVIKITPKLGTLMSKLISTGIRVLKGYIDDLARAGLDLIISLLDGFAKKIPVMADKAGDVAVAFIKAMAKQGVKLANAGLDALIDFLNGLADAIRSHNDRLIAAGGNVASAIIEGIKSAIGKSVGAVRDAIIAMVKAAAKGAGGAVKGAVKAVVPGLRTAGEALTGSFAGLVAGQEDQAAALDKIRGQIQATLEKAGKDVDKWKSKLKELEKAKVKDPEAIAHAKKMLGAARKLAEQADAADKHFKKIMKTRGGALRELAKEYDKIQAQIAAAQDKIDEAVQKQTDFKNSVKQTFGTLPDISAGQSLASYMRQLEKQKAKIEQFKATLAALRAAGLSDDAYQQFLSEGVDAQRIMDELLAGGPDAIRQFEAATGGINSATDALAAMASNQLGYDKAVAEARQFMKGIVDGVGSAKSLAEIEAAMGKIARIMMRALKKELQIKSPSRKAAEVGKFFVIGLTNQMDRMHRDVERSSEALGGKALDTLQATLSRVGEGVHQKIKLDPVISPVLDLTKLSKDANKISSLLATNPLSTDVSFAQASNIMQARKANDDDSSDEKDGGTHLYFEQYNTSPKALDDVTIYRDTHSLLSVAKEALEVK